MAHYSSYTPAPGFARHPEYSISIEPSPSLHQLVCNEAVIAATEQAVVVREQNLFGVLYIPKSDILVPLSRMKGQSSYCPFKGQATYWRIESNGKNFEKAAWSYEMPYDEMLPIRGHVAFYLNHLDCYWIDGADQPLLGPGRCTSAGELASAA